jgi:hypothetical protein
VLHTPALGAGRQQVLVMRVYVPDRGRDILGGVGLPEAELTLADGRKLTGQAACDALNTTQAPVLTAAALSIPLDDFAKLSHQPDKPAHWPATNPLSWFVQYDRKFLLGIYTGERPAGARKSEAGSSPTPTTTTSGPSSIAATAGCWCCAARCRPQHEPSAAKPS